MSKKLRKLAKSDATNRILTGFLAFCLVFEMLPAQSIAYALDATSDALEEAAAEPPAPQDVVVTEAPAAQEPAADKDPEATADPAAAPEPVAEPEATAEEATVEAEPVAPAADTAEPEAAPAPAHPVFNQDRWTESTLVNVSAAEGVLPEGTYMDVSDVTTDDLRNAAAQAISGDLNSAQALRLTFTLDGEPVAPKGDVRVTVSYANASGERVSVLSVGGQGTVSQLPASANVQAWEDVQQFTLSAGQSTRAFVIAGFDAAQGESEDATLADAVPSADETLAGGGFTGR